MNQHESDGRTAKAQLDVDAATRVGTRQHIRTSFGEPTLRRLERRAQREGVSVDELAARLLDEAAEQDPYEFNGAATGGPLYAERVDDALAETGFGKPRS